MSERTQLPAREQIRNDKILRGYNRGSDLNAARAMQPWHQAGSGQLSATSPGPANPGGSPTQIDGIHRNYAAEAAANSAVANSSVPSNINTPNTQSEGAIAASPKPFMPSPYALNLPDQRAPENMTPEQGDQWEKAAVARNLAQTQPGGLSQYQSPPNVIPAPPLPPEIRPAARGDVTTTTMPHPFTASIGRQMNNDGSFGPPAPPGPSAALNPAPGNAATAIPSGNSATPAYDRQSAHASLAASHPGVMTLGSPENKAFIEHAKQRMASGRSREQAIDDAYQQAPALFNILKRSGSIAANTPY